MQKLPWSFRLRQAWALIVHGEDRRYETLLGIAQEEALNVERLKSEIKAAWKEFDHPEFQTWKSLKDPCRIAMKAWWSEYRRQHPAPPIHKLA